MIEYLANLIKVRGLTLNNILPECKTIKIRLAKKDSNKQLILNL